MSYKVETLHQFENEAKKLSKKYASLKSDLEKLIISLAENPKQGTPIGNNFYKIRLHIRSKGKGKSGGGRVITFVKVLKTTVYLAALYDKSEKSTITDAELKQLAKILI